jgi:outer membrane protein assembly factor BamD
MTRILASIAFGLWLCALGACSSNKDKPDQTKNWSAERLYAEAKSLLDQGAWEKSSKMFETLESRYPYGKFAQQAQLDIAYAYYKQDESVSAIAAADRFIKLHPNHPNVDYAYYLKGLANFKDDLGLFGQFSGQDLSERDQKAAREAFDTFKELVTRYPDSIYTPDAMKRMDFLVNSLASNEVHVARYYLRRGAWVAAVNRAQNTIASYPRAPAVEEALAIMVTAYDKLGMKDLRDDTARVLKTNFPKSAFRSDGTRAAWWKIW